jgi:hypothetical protein
MELVTSREQHAHKARALAEALGGSVQEEVKVSLEREGVVFTIEPFQAGETPSHWNAAISAPLAVGAAKGGSVYRGDGRPRVRGRPDLELRARGLGDALGERLGLDSPVVADPTQFARLVAVESGAPRAIQRSVLAAPAARAAVIDLLRAGCPAVKLHASAGRVAVQLDDRSAGSLREPVEQVLPLLARLLAALPVFEECARTWRRPVIEWLGPLLGFLSFIGGVLLTVVGMFSWEPESHDGVLRLALRCGLPVWALLAPLFFLLCRRCPTALLTFCLTMVLMLIGLPALAAGSALAFNAKLDRGPTEIRTVAVLRREQETTRKGTRFFLRVGSWRTGQGDPERVGVTEAQHATAREGQRLRFRLRPGRLGWRWEEGWELEAR